MTAQFISCQWNAASYGAGSFVVASAVAGYNVPSALNAVDGGTYRYYATDGTLVENGTGVWSAGSNTLTRAPIDGAAALAFTTPPVVSMFPSPAPTLEPPPATVVRYDIAQSLTSAERAQAQSNVKVSGPTVTVLTSGTAAAYNPPTGCTAIRVRGVGGGGGSGANASIQTDGGTTSFAGAGITTMTATGGAKGTGAVGTAAAGGVGSNGHINFKGGDGIGCHTSVAGMFIPGFPGGASFLFPTSAKNGGSPDTNSGAGGGAVAFNGAGDSIGCGAGGGGFERWISAPAAAYIYTIGAQGAAGSGGFVGAAGIILIEEFYN